ncbi:unnamed protein product [Lota lota]
MNIRSPIVLKDILCNATFDLGLHLSVSYKQLQCQLVSASTIQFVNGKFALQTSQVSSCQDTLLAQLNVSLISNHEEPMTCLKTTFCICWRNCSRESTKNT